MSSSRPRVEVAALQECEPQQASSVYGLNRITCAKALDMQAILLGVVAVPFGGESGVAQQALGEQLLVAFVTSSVSMRLSGSVFKAKADEKVYNAKGAFSSWKAFQAWVQVPSTALDQVRRSYVLKFHVLICTVAWPL